MIKLVRQQDTYGCGVACLAMIGKTTYLDAKATFVILGMDSKRQNKQPFASNFSDLRDALNAISIRSKLGRWVSWRDIGCRGILKVRRARGKKERDWHWVVVEPHAAYGLIIHDPEHDLPSYLRPPIGQPARPLEEIEPYGSWIKIL